MTMQYTHLGRSGATVSRLALGTKLYINNEQWPNYGGLSALYIRRAVEDSLRRLGTDHIDLYQFHHVDRSTPWDELWEATERLVRDGKVVYVGSSNFAGWHLAQASEMAKARHFLGLVSEQSIYNLMERTIELEVLPAAPRDARAARRVAARPGRVTGRGRPRAPR